MTTRLSRCILGAMAVSALACARHTRSTPLPGEYTRASARLMEGGQVLPVPTDGQFGTSFPSSVRLDNTNGFVVESGDAQLNGHYRLERDSIFLEQDTDGGTKLAFAGRASGDTLDVHWIPTSGQQSANYDVELIFVRSK